MLFFEYYHLQKHSDSLNPSLTLVALALKYTKKGKETLKHHPSVENEQQVPFQ
jgi:hypothetical protein